MMLSCKNRDAGLIHPARPGSERAVQWLIVRMVLGSSMSTGATPKASKERRHADL